MIHHAVTTLNRWSEMMDTVDSCFIRVRIYQLGNFNLAVLGSQPRSMRRSFYFEGKPCWFWKVCWTCKIMNCHTVQQKFRKESLTTVSKTVLDNDLKQATSAYCWPEIDIRHPPQLARWYLLFSVTWNALTVSLTNWSMRMTGRHKNVNRDQMFNRYVITLKTRPRFARSLMVLTEMYHRPPCLLKHALIVFTEPHHGLHNFFW